MRFCQGWVTRKKENVLFLIVSTGTITPAPGAKVFRNDPVLRREDYLQSFLYWLKHPDPRLRHILFCENSNADLSEFHEAAASSGKQVEIISIPPNPPPPGMHYGYSELQMMDVALASSCLRRATTHMIKMTGRLTFPALPALLDKLPKNLRIAVDARARLPFRPSHHGFIATQLFVASHDFYDTELRQSYSSLTDMDHYPFLVEHLFFERLAYLKQEDGLLLRFPVNCEPDGFRGHVGKRYNSRSRVLMRNARALSRVITPNFWL